MRRLIPMLVLLTACGAPTVTTTSAPEAAPVESTTTVPSTTTATEATTTTTSATTTTIPLGPPARNAACERAAEAMTDFLGEMVNRYRNLEHITDPGMFDGAGEEAGDLAFEVGSTCGIAGPDVWSDVIVEMVAYVAGDDEHIQGMLGQMLIPTCESIEVRPDASAACASLPEGTTDFEMTPEAARALVEALFNDERSRLAELFESSFLISSVDLLDYDRETGVLSMGATSAFPSLLSRGSNLADDGWEIMQGWKAYLQVLLGDADDELAEMAVPTISVTLSGHRIVCDPGFMLRMLDLRVTQADFVAECIG